MASPSSSRKRKRRREKRKEKRKRKRQKREEKRRKREKKQKKEEEAESEDDDVVDFSVTEAKESLGLGSVKDINEVDDTFSNEYMDFKKKYKKASKKLKKKLKPELTCSLCLDVLKQPVTASCGHSYCRVCLCRALTKMTDDYNRFSCPQCRKRLCVKCLKRFSVNKSLSLVLETLFKESKPTEKEYAIFQIALKELRGDLQSISRPSVVRTEEFEIMKGVTCKRTVVTDPLDPVMRFTLGLSKDFEKCFTSNSYSDFAVYFLHLEEDEDDQPRQQIRSGFPMLFTEPSSIFQKQDFEKNIFVKYRTEEDDSEMTVGALNGRSIFTDVFIHPDSSFAKIRIAVPEYSELFVEISIALKEVDDIYRREVFSALNQNYSIGSDDESLLLDDEICSDASFLSNDDDYIENSDSLGSFIVDDDESIEVESETDGRRRRNFRRIRLP